MEDDHLDKPISVALAVTESGLEARAKSRALSALDRLIGNLADRWNASLESGTTDIRAKTAARKKFIEGLGDSGSAILNRDPEFAADAIEMHLGITVNRQINKNEVVAAALEDLRSNPPSSDEATKGDEKLSNTFLDRLGRYAEDATEDQVRDKWGKVLAAEIRRPGTFSPKVMRVIDELDQSTALLFEKICQNRLGRGIIKCLAGPLSFSDRAMLVTAGLLVDPGFSGQQITSRSVTDDDGKRLFFINFELASLGIAQSVELVKENKGELLPLIKTDNGVAVPVFVLTDEGLAISSILEDKQEQALSQILNAIANQIAPAEVLEYRQFDLDKMKIVRRIAKSVAAT